MSSVTLASQHHRFPPLKAAFSAFFSAHAEFRQQFSSHSVSDSHTSPHPMNCLFTADQKIEQLSASVSRSWNLPSHAFASEISLPTQEADEQWRNRIVNVCRLL